MKILFVDPHESSLFSFRKELLDKLIENNEVVLCTEVTDRTRNYFGDKVSKIVDVPMNLKSKGIISNLKLVKQYRQIIQEEKPNLIISYKVKPNIYCGLSSRNIPMIANITGLGNIFKDNGIISKIGVFLYRKSFKNVDYVFFQNTDGLKFFTDNKITINDYQIIPGSGVNTNVFFPEKIQDNGVVNFLYASRMIKEKGFYLLLNAIPQVIAKNKNVHFNFLSAEEDIMSDKIAKDIISKYPSYITVLPRTDDMQKVCVQNDFLVSPSYYREGISNVLLESLACGRPIITTRDNPGCKEVLQENANGIGVISNDLDSLVSALIKASFLSKETIETMGLYGRESVVERYNRDVVIDIYLDTIKKIKDRKL